jgi:DNA-binding XRE family transcriptional regulator
LSQLALAERAGCNQFTVAKLERGQQEPAWPLVLALANALGVNCLAFVDDETGEPREKRGPGRPPSRKAETDEDQEKGKPERKKGRGRVDGT